MRISDQVEATKRWPVFQEWVRLAKGQDGILRREQYVVLETEFLRFREPVSSPLFGWGFGSLAILHRALREEGVTVSR